MKKIALIFLTSFFISCQAPQDKEFDSGSKIVKPDLTPDLINDLELLRKIWGFMKCYHPEVGKGKYDWDDELFQFLPEFMNVNDTRQRDESLLRWIEKYGELPECTTCKEP